MIARVWVKFTLHAKGRQGVTFRDPDDACTTIIIILYNIIQC